MRRIYRSCVILFLVPFSSMADEHVDWAVGLEAPFAGLVIEHALGVNHRVAISVFDVGNSDGLDQAHYGVRYRLLTGGGSHHAEYGIGLFVEDDDVERDNELVPVLSGGYRYEPVTGGFQFRAGAAWRPAADSVLRILPLPYVSVGWAY